MIPEKPSIGVCISTFGSYAYVALHLEALRRFNPQVVNILVVDDCSDKTAQLIALCKKYHADFISNPRRLGHQCGDIAAFCHAINYGSLWCLDLMVKFSRRFLPVRPWYEELQALAYKTQHHTYSSFCTAHNFGFRTECMGMHVPSHLTVLDSYRAGVLGPPKAMNLVEAYIHQDVIAKLPLNEISQKNTDPHGGFALWGMMGTSRRRPQIDVFWHESHSIDRYQFFDRQWELQLPEDAWH